MKQGTKLPRAAFDRSPEETTRLLCLGLLRDARKALSRMEDPQDTEALHDFRVGLRRLRSTLRAYRPYLKGSVSRKHRARWKELASSTNVARDTEVQIEWLSVLRDQSSADELAGARHLLDHLEHQQREAVRPEALAPRFRELEEDLQARLRWVRFELDGAPALFVTAAAGLLRDQGVALQESLSRAKSADDADALHDARIRAKRLRYLLEPFQSEIEATRSLIKRLKALQDCLGELQDTRVLADLISKRLESAALERARLLHDLVYRESPEGANREEADPSGGLLALLRRLRARRDERFRELAASWLGEPGSPFFRGVETLSRYLGHWPGQIPVRRFLLKELPEPARRIRPARIEEGWILGKSIKERVRSVHEGRRVSYWRIVELPEVPMAAVEEKLTKREFESLWPLTTRKRLERHRYVFRDGARSWTIDALPARGLVIAETATDATEETPGWIREVLAREVTGVARYEAEALARPNARPAGGAVVPFERRRSGAAGTGRSEPSGA